MPKDVIASLTSATTVIRAVGAASVGFLIIFAILVILMIIGFKIRLKRDEIEIMRLLGASSNFVRTPFILEGMFYGLTGALSSWVIICFCRRKIQLRNQGYEKIKNKKIKKKKN